MTVENPFAGQGAVLLDIGGDVGALVVLMPPAMEGIEVEINRIGGPDGDAPPRAHDHDHLHHDGQHDHGDPHDHHHHDHDDHDDHGHDHDHGHASEHTHGGGHRPHVAVVARPAPGGLLHSLVFPELTEGVYELYRRPAEPVALRVTIRGGEVTEAEWPEG